MRRTASVLTVLLCALPVLAGCGDDDTGSPPASAGDSTTVDITFSDGSVTPNGERVEVKAGEPIELVVEADEPGELHVHSSPEQELEYDAGTTTLKLTVDQPGVVDVESPRSEGRGPPARGLLAVPDDGFSLAHGIGGAKDLPIPPELAILGAVAALTVSFTVLAIAWRSPRYDESTTGRPAPEWLARVVDSTAFRVALRVLGLVVFAYTAVAAVFGQDLLTNPVFGIFYVWWWVGLVVLSVVFGPVWKAISPVRTINLAFARLSGSDPEAGVFRLPRPARLLAGRARALRVRVDGARLPLLHRARPGPPVVRDLRRGDAPRRRPVRKRVLRAR